MLNKLRNHFQFQIHRLSNPILWTQTSESIFKVINQYGRKSMSLLEIGSGTGHLSYMLAKRGFSVSLNDIRPEVLNASKNIFKENNLRANYIKGDFTKILDTFDFAWNTGLIQCIPPKERNEFISRIRKIAPEVLLFYPDTQSPYKDIGKNTQITPGVDDAKEYEIQDIPERFYSHFSHIEHGTLLAEEIKLPYNMYWIYGNKPL